MIEQADANTIGDHNPAIGRNVISGNSNHGINIQGADSTLIYSNYIGLDLTGALRPREWRGWYTYFRAGS